MGDPALWMHRQAWCVSTSSALDARKSLTGEQIAEVPRCRARDEVLALSVARAEEILLSKRISELNTELADNNKQIPELVKDGEAAPFLEAKGFGAFTATTCSTVSFHHGWVHSEAAYAALAGVNPIPASSGNTIRHQLNRARTVA